MAIVHCGPACTTEMKNSGQGCGDPVHTYVGAVLDTYEVNGYDDSDFVAIVWDEDAEKVTTVEYASTRGWTYHNGARIDATDEAKAKALVWYRAYYQRITVQDAEHEATLPQPGRTVRSLTTRGKNKGVVGVVQWYGPDKYRRAYESYQPMRVAIIAEGESERRWLPAESVAVVTPEPVDVAAIAARAAVAVPHNWRSALYLGVASVLGRRAA